MNRSVTREVVATLLRAGRRDLAVEFVRAGEGGFRYNIATTPLAKAQEFAREVFRAAGKDLDEELPDFGKNYMRVQATLKKARSIPRIEMPVIEPTDMKEFHARLKSGRLDIFQPYAKGKLHAPKNLRPDDRGKEWLELGVKDGNPKDDVVPAKWTSIPAKNLLPTQSQIWLDKVAGNIARFGTPKQGSSVTEQTIIVSKEGYILDGHHRFGQAMVADPKLKLKALFIPIDIDTLVKVGRTYGNTIGNEQKG